MPEDMKANLPDLKSMSNKEIALLLFKITPDFRLCTIVQEVEHRAWGRGMILGFIIGSATVLLATWLMG